MNHLLQKNLMLFTSSRSPLQSCTHLVQFQLSKLLSSSPPYSHGSKESRNVDSHRQRESRNVDSHRQCESRNVKVSVWWDFENCCLPSGFNIYKVVPAIRGAVRANGIKGPLRITAVGDLQQLSRPNREALPLTGIHVTHLPSGGKNCADRSLSIDLIDWILQNPPPLHIFLISGDKDFAPMLQQLRMRNYNILIACLGNGADVLRSAATIMWEWTSLLKGEDLTGKYFNHPPDGQFGSLYGNSPFEDSFSDAEQSTPFENSFSDAEQST